MSETTLRQDVEAALARGRVAVTYRDLVPSDVPVSPLIAA